MTKAYEINIGDIRCAALFEGEADMPLETLQERYPDASRAQIQAALGGEAPSGSLNLLYIESGGARILADVGFGSAGPPGTGGTLSALGSLGLSAADIDIVYLTHFHGDHIAGFFDAAGQESFPNARYITMLDEWDEWMQKWALAGDPQLARIAPLRPRFSFVYDGDEIAPGVTVVGLMGHTEGHSGLLVESGGERLLHVVDILHQPFQFTRTDWHFSFDTHPELAVDTRRHTLQRCADEGILTLFYHLPFPGLGYVRAAADGFSWEPISQA